MFSALCSIAYRWDLLYADNDTAGTFVLGSHRICAGAAGLARCSRVKSRPCPGEVACCCNPDRATRRRAGSARRHPRQSGRVALPRGAWALQSGRDDRATLRSTDKESKHEEPQSARRQAGSSRIERDVYRRRKDLWRAQLRSAAGGRVARRRRMAVGHPRPAVLDMMSAYSAVSHGHAHPRIVTALVAQAQQLAVTSRAFHNDKLPPFLKRLTEVTGLARALPANGGAEAVETAIESGAQVGIQGQADSRRAGRSDRVRRQLSRPRRSPSSGSRRRRNTATASGRSRRDSRRSRSATPARSKRRSRRIRRLFWSSRCRAKRG